MTTFTLRYIEGAFLVTSKDIEARKSESRREAKDWCASHTRNFGFSGKLPGDGNSAPRWAYFDGSGEAALEKRMIRWPAFQSSASLPSVSHALGLRFRAPVASAFERPVDWRVSFEAEDAKSIYGHGRPQSSNVPDAH